MDHIPLSSGVPPNWVVILVITLVFTFTVMFVYYKFDEFDPEPVEQVFVAFLYGVVTPLFTVPFYYFVIEFTTPLYTPQSVDFIELVIFAPIVEEIAKAVLLLQLFKKYRVDGPMDGLIYGVALGAGFSTIENLIYGLSALLEAGFVSALQLTLVRGGFAFIGHPIYSGIFGWGVGAHKVKLVGNAWSEIKYSILLHGMWNSVFILPRLFYLSLIPWIIVIIFVVMVTGVQIHRRVRIARKIERKLEEAGYYSNATRIGYRVR